MNEYISREAVFQVVHGIARGIAEKDIEALRAKDMKTFYKVKGAKEILDSVDTDLCYIPAADVISRTEVLELIESFKVQSTHKLSKSDFDRNDTLRLLQDVIRGVTREIVFRKKKDGEQND